MPFVAGQATGMNKYVNQSENKHMRIKSRFWAFLIAVPALFLSSCESGLDLVEVESKVYLTRSGAVALTPLLGESVYELGVYRSGINQKSKVTVDVQADPSVAGDFLRDNAGYQLLPEMYYTIPGNNVEFGAADERKPFKIYLRNIDEAFTGRKFVLPVKIRSVSGSADILETKNTVFLTFSRYRNVFEGTYKAYGRVYQAGSSSPEARIDEEVKASSVTANTVLVNGAEGAMKIHLTVQNGEVVVTGAPGSEAFKVRNTGGKPNTYTGTFNPAYQANEGTFTLNYTYTSGGKEKEASVELKFWL